MTTNHTRDSPSAPIDTRKLALTNWVTQQTSFAEHPIELFSLGSDAGFRRYFRYQTPSQWLAVDAPPASEDTHQFLAIARLIEQQGVRSPRIATADANQGFLLVEDMGDRLFFRAVNTGNVDDLYQMALSTLLQLQHIQDDAALIPRYDRALLRRELEIFSEWFAGKLLGHPLATAEKKLLDELFIRMEDNALAQPQTFVHRDYHSRNLLLLDDNALGVIDFQGALWGGVTYDLVSLLRDCYLHWPAEKVTGWALDYRQQAISANIIPDVSETEFLRWFDWLGLQRHIKVLGIFARLNLRDGKTGYLNDLPLVIRYTLEVAEQYPELKAFVTWFKQTLLPLAQQQSWYRDYQSAGDQ
ncbi:aminoglycoside phosphotransferase family protein [Cellvibrio fibrivorans]|uniref:Aminoglycoside/choline kinase family phosphotransferase n=1 Tax=Cellvibrio fibrivorans TaxID=126350 RepID=A0ABU1US66_9GAMM|nr:phosphotransferase [Cellvibrio fibrivorans]MDR7088029.1 aminoglycoside/choline kinase family phosphotransferase [Cellvibrio fibrivorans]